MPDNTKRSQQCWWKYKFLSFFEEQLNKFIRILSRYKFDSAILLTEIYPTNILINVYQYISSRIVIRYLFIIANKLSIGGFLYQYDISIQWYIVVFKKN